MDRVRVDGENNRHKVLLYALSTCAWCKLTKKFLSDNRIAYEYVDIDLVNQKDRQLIRKDIEKHGGDLTYPTIIVDDKTLITGFRKDKIAEALNL